MHRLIQGGVALCLLACHDGLITEAGGAKPSGVGAGSALLAPSQVGFDLVADALIASCGTLDCHGQPGRNLRLFGSHGLRLSATDDPGGMPTSAEEREASYWSVVGLEPEATNDVVREAGARPERLSLIRKGRGLEKHKGGTLTTPGDPLDQCLLAWLSGRLAQTACMAAVPKRP